MSNLRFAFYGRVSTEDHQDPDDSRSWQMAQARAVIDGIGSIVVEYFDIGTSRSLPWPRRPQASALLDAARSPERGWDAIVVGDHTRAFFGDQFATTLPTLAHHGVHLWVPGIGRVDPENITHELLMSINGMLSKNDREAMRIKVREGMAAQVREGLREYMGGRPPYGYRLESIRPHPNPGKAADGKMLHRLCRDPETAAVVERIFSEFAEGEGLRSIAQRLTDEGIASPSASDRRRNPHRAGLAWAHAAVRAILTNPTYTGFTVHGRTRKVEVLLDPEVPAQGKETKRVKVPEDKWVWSPAPTHEALIDRDTWDRVAARLRRSAPPDRAPATRRPRTPTNPDRVYLLAGHLKCSICGHRLAGQTNRSRVMYRCRHRNEYAVSDRHPKNVYVPEAAVVPGLHDWLADLFAPDRLDASVEALLAMTGNHDPTAQERDRLDAVIRKATADQQALIQVAKAGGSAEALAAEINATEIRLREAQEQRERLASVAPPTVTPEAVKAVLEAYGSALLEKVEPLTLRKSFEEIGLMLTYDPDTRSIAGEMTLSMPERWAYVRVGGGTCTFTPRAFRPSRYAATA